MNKRSNLIETLRLVSYVSQFGLSVVMPIVLCVMLGVWLNRSYGVGEWLIVLLLAVGLVSSGCGFFRFVRPFILQDRKASPSGGEGDSKDEN
jgi:hypothetical protein